MESRCKLTKGSLRVCHHGVVGCEVEHPPTVTEAFAHWRKAWFDGHLRSYAHDREWETESQEAARNQANEELSKKFNAQTRGIIAGEPWTIAPRCLADLD